VYFDFYMDAIRCDLAEARVWGQELSRSRTIHVFRCGTSALFALTADRTGRILPLQVCGPAGWHFERSLLLQLGKEERRHELTKATLAAIAKHGFYLTHAAIHTMPIDDAPFPKVLTSEQVGP
jgi:hypothetical protein